MQGLQRVLVYGVAGSGKTTLSRRLAALTGLPHVVVDDLCPRGWAGEDPEDQRRRVHRVCAGDAWVLDGAFEDWVDVPLARAQLVVALDYPRWFSFQRLARRTAVNAAVRVRAPRRSGAGRSVRRPGGSAVGAHVRSFRRKHDRIASWAADPQGPALVRLTTGSQADAWLREVARDGPESPWVASSYRSSARSA